MMRFVWPILCGVLILAAAGGALAFRLPRLDQRPMHTDEAVQAAKFGDLFDNGRYEYDPVEYHGPTLYYLTLPVAWLAGPENYAQTTERMYRAVPLIFGVGVVVLLVLVMDGLGGPAVVCAAILTAVSHAMTFYSRYYIQEMLLVFFTFGAIACGWRYARRPGLAWAVGAGVFLGLMHATKETCVLAMGSLAVALAVVLVWRRRSASPDAHDAPQAARPAVRRQHLIALAAAGVVVSVVFFTSFFTHARGPIDSVLTYTYYADKAHSNVVHNHPWHYYLHMLVYWKDAPRGDCPVFSEALIVSLALVGVVVGLVGRGLGRGSLWFVRFLAVYTVTMTLVYSAIPYKTPWSMLGVLHGMILLAGVGAAALLRLVPLLWTGRGMGPFARTFGRTVARLAVGLLLAGGCYQLAMQTYMGCLRYYVDPRTKNPYENPYIYGHSLKDMIRLGKRVEKLAEFHPDGHEMVIQVIAPTYWPVPWYLRRFKNVGYYNAPPELIAAPVVILGQPDEDDPASIFYLEKVLDENYEQVEIYGLRVRPSVFLQVFAHKELWAKFLQTRKDVRKKPPPPGKRRRRD